MAAIQRPVRSRPMRVFLFSMFAVPLVSLIALWVYAASIAVPRAIGDHNYNTISKALTGPAVSTLTIDLPVEQAQTYVWLLSNRTAPKAALLAVRKTVDNALPQAEVALQSQDNLLSPTAKAALNALLSDLRQLDSLRQEVDSGSWSAAAAFQGYSNIVDAQFQAYYAEDLDRGGSSLGTESVGAIDVAYSLDMASREIALADGALAVSNGLMSPDVRQLFNASTASRRLLLTSGMSLLTPPYRAGYEAAISSPMYKQFVAMEDQIAVSPADQPIPVGLKAWQPASGQYMQVMLGIQTANAGKFQAQSGNSSNSLLTQAILAGGVGLLAVIGSVFLLVWLGRKFTGDMTKLNDSVRRMAEERLPRVVERLRRGEDVDVAAESPPPGVSSVREISAIAESFATVQEAAVAAAVDQARLHKGVNQVFLNISMRNQSLLHRQLGMLDAMERQTGDPGALADLFRLDHLTTRMRRHAEGLIILSGSTPGRGWREPVPVVDVLRAAVAEVEDYVRVDVLSESRDLIAGNAVNDVIHLVAELVENASVFSPPNTRIEVRADRVGTGLVAEIEDRGLGLSPSELADINGRLASPPEFDLANSEQLGLFVVARLAVRHSIKVALRQSVYGGTTAIVVLPFGVIVREEEAGSPGRGESPAGVRPALPPGTVLWEPYAGEPLPPVAGALDSSAFGVTGRHRLPPAAAGRPAAGGGPGDADPGLPPGRTALPRAPWEGAHAPQPPAPPAWGAEAMTPWPHAFRRATTGPQVSPSARGGDLASGRQEAGVAGRPAGDDRPGMGPVSSSAVPSGPLSSSTVSSSTVSSSTVSSSTVSSSRVSSSTVSSGSHLGMPVRIPQASLAPQLRARQATTGAQPAAHDAPGVDERSPEATRTMMLQMQQGWQRGRVDDLDDPQGAPDDGTNR
jgi:signal transduction histidine kinase